MDGGNETPPPTADPDAVGVLIEYGRSHGRPCDGAWVDEAYKAVSKTMADGHPIDAISAAWRKYVDDTPGTKADLAHWLRGQSLTGAPRDYGDKSAATLIASAEKKAAKEAETRRIEAGGIPTPLLEHWRLGDKSGWMVSWEGVYMMPYEAVPPDATKAEAEAAFEDWYTGYYCS